MISDLPGRRWLAVCGFALCSLTGMGPATAVASNGQGSLMVAHETTIPDRVMRSASAMADRLAVAAEPGEQGLVVDVRSQWLYLFESGELVGHFPVSTAERGVGNREGSLQTPLGLHRVDEKIGAEAPRGMIFRGRQPTGELAEILEGPDERAARDDVTTRILWLQGLEPGVNQGGDVDSKQRYIYIHGTPEEGRIGRPASHGCVRMTNADVITLFDRVQEGALVDIIE